MCLDTNGSTLKGSHHNQQKPKQLIKHIDELFSNVESAFSSGVQIPQVVLMFGATIVSPKEMYVIDFPCQAGMHCRELSRRQCLRKVFHSLFTDPKLYEIKSMPLTCFTMLMRTTRDCGLEWFTPKIGYNIPPRGTKIILDFVNEEDLDACELSPSFPDDIKFLPSPESDDRQIAVSSTDDKEHKSPSGIGRSEYDSSCSTSPENSEGVTVQHFNSFENKENTLQGAHFTDSITVQDCDLIWYQAPISIKGFRYKACRESRPEDLLA